MFLGTGIISFKKNGEKTNIPTQIGVFIDNEVTVADYTATNLTATNPTPSTLRLVQPVGLTSTHYSAYFNNWATDRENFKMTATFTINTKDADSWGIGLSIGVPGDDRISGMIGNGLGFNDNTIYLFQGAGNVVASASGTLPTTAIGDVIYTEFSINVNTYTLYVENITQGGSQTITYSETYTSGVLKIIRAVSYYGFRLFGGDYTITDFKVSTEEYKYCDVLLVSDSKGYGAYCDNVNNKAIEIVKANHPTKKIHNNSGFNETSVDVTTKQNELLGYKASQVWIMTGSNDIRYAVVDYNLKYDAIIAAHQANGSVVKILNCICEGAGGAYVIDMNTYWSGTGLEVYDLYTPSQTADVLKAIYNSGDNVHPNSLFNINIIAQAMLTLI